MDLLLSIDSENHLNTKLYDKRDDFDFHIVNFPFLDSNIPSSPAYGVYISQLIRYARACSKYADFIDRSKILTSKLLSQNFQKDKLIVALKKFCGRYLDLFDKFSISVSQFTKDVF